MRYSIPILSSILLFLFGCQTIPKQKKATPYNVLFITVDDLRPELGCYGSNLAQSPNIDALAAKSLVFERAYCQAPICSPSRMSFLSGLRPHETDINNNKTHIRRKLPNVVTLPQHFKNLGYQTIGIGKVFHGGLTDTASWHVQSDGPPQRMYNLERNLKINVPKTPPGQKSRRGRPYENADVADGLYTDGMIVNRAVEELDKLEKNQAFLLAVGFLKTHLPFNAPHK
ncbi:MAG: sulfatase-like hydrolase/transferase, partial [Bacteroidota bacterium]